MFALLVQFMAAAEKKHKNRENDVALVVGIQQNLSNLYYLDIYGWDKAKIQNSLLKDFHHFLASERLCQPIHPTSKIGGFIVSPK